MRGPRWLLILVAVPMTLLGQSGSGATCCSQVTARVQAGQITLHEANVGGAPSHEWLQAVVLWRAHDDWNGSNPSTGKLELDRQIDAARATSRERGRQYLGGVNPNGFHYVEYDRQHLWALDQEFILPSRDSALVVMVDGLDAPGGPRVVGYAYIAAEMPESFWTKIWRSGDTTFMVHTQKPDGLLLEALRASSVVRAFVDPAAP